MENNQSQDVFGRCYCGAVRFRIAAKSEPFWSGYCHCKDCRQANAATIYQYVYVEQRFFQIIDGSALLKWYTRTKPEKSSLKRFFCERCGSKVYNYVVTNKNHTELELCGTFPSLFDDQETAASPKWRPRMHVHCAQSIIDLSLLQDNLPQFQTE